MKFEIEQKDFLNALNCVKGAVENRNVIETLKHIKINAEEGAVTLTGTNIDIEIKKTVFADVEICGEATFDTIKANSVISRLSNEKPIVVELINNHVVIKQGRSRVKLPSLLPSDFLSLPVTGDIKDITLSAHDIRELLSNTHFTSSHEETRWSLNGVYIHTDGPSIIAVAIDGLTFSKYKMDFDSGVIDGITLPNKLVSELLRIIADVDQDVLINIGQGSVRFDMNDTIITSRLIDAKFPDYESVIPDGNNDILCIEQSDIKTALDMAVIFADKINNRVKFGLKENGMAISTEQDDFFKAVDGVFNGANFDIFYDTALMINIIKHLKGELIMSFNGVGKPVIIEPTEKQGALYIVTPQGERTS